jgi:hypothetical protein
MPSLLPVQNVNTNAVDLGQGPSIARAGQSWDAIAKVGNTITNFAEQIGQKRKEAELKSFIDVSEKDFERDITNKQAELAAKYTGDPTGYASELNEYMNDWYAERQEMAPRDSVKEVFQQRFNGYTQDIGLKADAWENEKRAKYQIGQLDQSVLKDNQHLVQHPDPNSAAKFMSKTAEMVNNGVGLFYDQTEAQKRMLSYGNDTATSLFEGLESSKQYAAGMKVLSGKHPSSKIVLQHMDPKQIANYKDRFSRLQKAENEFSKKVFNTHFEDTIFNLQNGKKVEKEQIRGLMSMMSSIENPQERQLYADDLNTSLAFNQKLQDVASLPLADAQAAASYTIPLDDSFNVRSRSEKQNQFSKAAENIIKERINNGATFHVKQDRQLQLKEQAALDNPAGLKDFFTSVAAKQYADDVKNPTIMTDNISKNYSARLKSGSPELAEEAYQHLKLGSGKHYGNAVAEMVKKKDLDPVHAMALYMGDDRSRQEFMGMIRKQKEIEDTYKGIKGADSEIENLRKGIPLDPDVQSIQKALAVVDPTGENLWLNKSMNDSIVLAYKYQMTKPGMSPDQARKNAIGLVKNNFNVASSGQSAVIVPAEYQGQVSEIEDHMASALKMDRLKTMDLMVPN